MSLEFVLGGGGGGGDEQATNVPIRVNQPLVRGHPEAATGRDETHCGQCEKYLKNQSRKHLLAGEVLDFLEQEPSSFTRAPTHLNIYAMPVDVIIKGNLLKREMETLQLNNKY